MPGAAPACYRRISQARRSGASFEPAAPSATCSNSAGGPADRKPEETAMTRMTGGKALVEMLRRHGAETIFALPGVQNDALFVAFYDAGEALRVIHTRHEQGAAYMAYGYRGRPASRAPMPWCRGRGCSTPRQHFRQLTRPTRRCCASAVRSPPT